MVQEKKAIYCKALVELNEIIKHMSQELQSKITQEIRQEFIRNMDKDYRFNYDETIPLEKQERLAVLFSRDFQDRIFGRPYDMPKKQREQITSEEIDKLYKEYCEIIKKFPQDLLKILEPMSYGRVYDQVAKLSLNCKYDQNFFNQATFFYIMNN